MFEAEQTGSWQLRQSEDVVTKYGFVAAFGFVVGAVLSTPRGTSQTSMPTCETEWSWRRFRGES